MLNKYKNMEESFVSFGSELIKRARANLNKDGKRAGGTLFNQMSYDFNTTDSGIKFNIDFGNASDYWIFVDQGVQGAGGATKGVTKKGEQGKRGGTGLKRGMGSPFSFKPSGKQPPISAILEWVKTKGLKGKSQRSIAYAISLSVKRRGLERTLFITKPYQDLVGELPTQVRNAFALDYAKMINDLLKDKTQ
tara:strand:+ start:1121 stop:1696 length:576 start_codon:yes stop_codon:yes gene_type:complete